MQSSHPLILEYDFLFWGSGSWELERKEEKYTRNMLVSIIEWKKDSPGLFHLDLGRLSISDSIGIMSILNELVYALRREFML